MKRKCFGNTLYMLSITCGQTRLTPYKQTPIVRPIYNNYDASTYTFSQALDLKNKKINLGGRPRK